MNTASKTTDAKRKRTRKRKLLQGMHRDISLMMRLPQGDDAALLDQMDRKVDAMLLPLLVEEIVAQLERRPSGLQEEQLARQLGLLGGCRCLLHSLQRALKSRRIGRKGDQRATIYFVTAGSAGAKGSTS